MKDFLDLANSVLNARKSRAGTSLENHVQHLLTEAAVPFESQVRSITGTPDIVIPNAAAYEKSHRPRERVCVLGIKRTCKDRWRQVVKEAPKVERKHILTLQEGISKAQMEEMRDAKVTLVVPESLQPDYPTGTGLEVLTVNQFIDFARTIAR